MRRRAAKAALSLLGRRFSILFRKGKGDMEGAAMIQARFHPNAPAMAFDDAFADGQPDARAAAIAIV